MDFIWTFYGVTIENLIIGLGNDPFFATFSNANTPQ